jgi:hypothetical protein
MPDLPWYVYAMLLAPLALILGVAAYKTLQVRAAREWPSAAGKVVISNSEVRDVRVLDDSRETGHRFEQRNFANIVYEYTVRGAVLRNNRVSIGEDRGNFEVAETIAKYPAGMAVTVFYNPLHPNEAVLERDLPKRLWGCLGIGAAVVLAIVFGGVFGLNRLSEFLSARLADPKVSPLVMAFGAFGVVMALFALAMQKQQRLAMKWPVVTGTISMSDVEQYRAAPSEHGYRGAVMYQREVSYAYRFNDVDYTGIEARFATGRNPVVKVYVNPLNPSEATLNPRTGFAWVMWLLSAAFAAVTYYTAVHG